MSARARRTLLFAAFLALCSGLAAKASSNGTRTDSVALQHCVDRFDWMRYGGWFGDPAHVTVPAKVVARPCRIEIAYRLRRADKAYRDYLGLFFPCRVNRFGAYVCAEHAAGLPGRPARKGYNARYFIRTGSIRLDRPPRRPVATPKPRWVRRYPVDHAFIVPFDRAGRLREGLTLRGPTMLRCRTFADIPQRSRLLGCGAGSYCFVPRLPVRNGEGLACPSDRGSRVFLKGFLRVLR